MMHTLGCMCSDAPPPKPTLLAKNRSPFLLSSCRLLLGFFLIPCQTQCWICRLSVGYAPLLSCPDRLPASPPFDSRIDPFLSGEKWQHLLPTQFLLVLAFWRTTLTRMST